MSDHERLRILARKRIGWKENRIQRSAKKVLAVSDVGKKELILVRRELRDVRKEVGECAAKRMRQQ